MIEVKELTKTYHPKKGAVVNALKGINIAFEEKGLVFILGKSGSGKSTLLNMLGGLDQFDSGEIIVKGKSSKNFAQGDFDSYRNTFIGFIFQEYNILNDFTVGANIALAMELQGKKPTKENLSSILREVDLEGFGNRKPNELSGGQKQRVAIARALIKNPEIIMADEPTGALDSNTGKQVFDTLKRLSKDKLVIVVSHDREFAELYGDRVIEMKDGQVISDIKKYVAKSSDVNEGIQIINDKIIHIKSGYELTSQDMEMINDYLRNNKEQDSFISLDHRTNDKIKQAAQIDENGDQQAFAETSKENLKLKKYDGSKLKFIKAKLPLKSSLKMAAGSLKKKPFRLIMTVLLSMVAFSLFGLVNTMSSYDKMKAGTDSIIDSNVNYLAFTKEVKVDQGDWSYYSNVELSDEDKKNMEAKFPEQKFTPVITVNDGFIDFAENVADQQKLAPYGDFSYYPSNLYGVATLSKDVIDQMGYELNGELPKNDTEIVISRFTAEAFVAGGYLGEKSGSKGEKIKSVDEMIGKSLKLYSMFDKRYTITGILDTKFDGSRYEMFKQEKDPSVSEISTYMLQDEMRTVLMYSYHNLVYTTDHVWKELLEANVGVSQYGSTYDIIPQLGDNSLDVISVAEFSMLNESAKSKIVLFEDGKTSLNAGEVIYPINALSSTYPELYSLFAGAETFEEKRQILLDNKDAFEKLEYKLSVSLAENNWEADLQNVKIAGFDASANGSNDKLIVADGFLSKYEISLKGDYAVILGKMPSSRAGVMDAVAYSYDNGVKDVHYQLNNCTSSLIGSVNSLVYGAKNILLGIGIGFAVFAAVMLMNFISISISYRKREIGILRAVGARGRDVFAIFFQESAMIAIINWILSVCATAFAVNMLNTMFRTQYKLVITVFHFGILQVGIMLAISLAVAFVASFVPVFNVSRKKPIEVIRKN